MEKLELDMLRCNNGKRKLDPVQIYYSQLITQIKQLCENRNIATILLGKADLANQTAAMTILREATRTNNFKKVIAETPKEVSFISAKVEHIRRQLEMELADPTLIMAKGKQAQISMMQVQRAMACLKSD